MIMPGATRLIEQFRVKRNLYRVGDDINDDENRNMAVNGHESCACLERKRLDFRLVFYPDTPPYPISAFLFHDTLLMIVRGGTYKSS